MECITQKCPDVTVFVAGDMSLCLSVHVPLVSLCQHVGMSFVCCTSVTLHTCKRL